MSHQRRPSLLTMLLIGLMFSQTLFAEAQLKFEKKSLTIGNKTITVEIADTSEKSARGLMHRKSLAENSGMLFIFSDEAPRNFWMKNTFIPLDIGFFNSKRELINIQQMEPATSEMQVNLPTYPSKGPAMYALEVPKGWFAKQKVRPKQRFSLK